MAPRPEWNSVALALAGCVLALAAVGCSKSQGSNPTSPGAFVVSSVSPSNLATNVSPLVAVRIHFSVPIDAATVTTARVHLKDGGQDVPARVTAAGDSAVLTPIFALRTNEAYMIVLDSGIHSSGGTDIRTPAPTTFTTIAGTAVSGSLAGATTWTLAASPYVMTGQVQIPFGSSLTIQPGVVVDGEAQSLEIKGTLTAVGTVPAPIHFVMAIIDVGLNTVGTPASLQIENARLYKSSLYQARGIANYASLTLRNCVIGDLINYVYLWYPVADCLIEKNVFIHSQGFSVGFNAGKKVTIRNNAFFNAVIGTVPATIENWNTPADTLMLVTKNSFLNTDRVALSLEASNATAHMDGRNNFWSTSSIVVIQSMIHDKANDVAVQDTVRHVPFLSTPDPATPDPTPFIY